MKPSKDDYSLILGELTSQRLQLTLQLEVVEAGIVMLERKVKKPTPDPEYHDETLDSPI